jgi:hypothetical protein
VVRPAPLLSIRGGAGAANRGGGASAGSCRVRAGGEPPRIGDSGIVIRMGPPHLRHRTCAALYPLTSFRSSRNRALQASHSMTIGGSCMFNSPLIRIFHGIQRENTQILFHLGPPPQR